MEMPEQPVLLALSAAVVSLWWFVKDKIKTHDRKIEEIETNYIGRFEALTRAVTDGNAEIHRAIADLRVDLAKNYISKQDMSNNHQGS